MDLSNLLLEDVLYMNDEGKYELTTEYKLIENDRNKIVDDLFPYFDGLMSVLSKKMPFLSQYNLKVDWYSLIQVLFKYTRDVFGPRRLKSVLVEIANGRKVRVDMKLFGLKLNSYDPNIHRRIAYLFYWFGVYKPFIIEKSEGDQDMEIPEEKKYVVNYFNEFFTYCLIRTALSTCIMPINSCPMDECESKKAGLKDGDCYLTINIDEKEHIFELFLSRLHNNKLNRSSLELLFTNSLDSRSKY